MKYIKLEITEVEKQLKDQGTQGMLGDKALLMQILDVAKIENGADNRKFYSLSKDLDACEDGSWWVAGDDDIKWFLGKIDKLPYDQKYKDANGNEVSVYTPIIRKKIAALVEKIEAAPTSVPEELKK